MQLDWIVDASKMPLTEEVVKEEWLKHDHLSIHGVAGVLRWTILDQRAADWWEARLNVAML